MHACVGVQFPPPPPLQPPAKNIYHIIKAGLEETSRGRKSPAAPYGDRILHPAAFSNTLQLAPAEGPPPPFGPAHALLPTPTPVRARTSGERGVAHPDWGSVPRAPRGKGQPQGAGGGRALTVVRHDGLPLIQLLPGAQVVLHALELRGQRGQGRGRHDAPGRTRRSSKKSKGNNSPLPHSAPAESCPAAADLGDSLPLPGQQHLFPPPAHACLRCGRRAVSAAATSGEREGQSEAGQPGTGEAGEGEAARGGGGSSPGCGARAPGLGGIGVAQLRALLGLPGPGLQPSVPCGNPQLLQTDLWLKD